MQIYPDFLKQSKLQFVMNELRRRHYAYLVGGCVRDAVAGLPVSDIDIATDATPATVREIFSEFSAVKVIPTGEAHGTMTVAVMGESFEITTFRKDVSTDGRRATVAFSEDIHDDAYRRDFTMNALYMDYQGQVLDPTGEGIADLLARKVRFVGNAGDRCKEDYLRILRLFRFHAKYGKGPMDSNAYRAAADHAHGLDQVSGERIWAELKKLLSTHDPVDALLDMERMDVLEQLLPGHGHPLNVAEVIAVERNASMAPGWERRFVALMGYVTDEIPFPHSRDEAKAVAALVKNWRRGMIAAHAAFVTKDRSRALDCAVLARASGRYGWDDTVHLSIDRGMETSLPVVAQDFMDAGVQPGPGLGACMRTAFSTFVASDLMATKEQLLNRVLSRQNS